MLNLIVTIRNDYKICWSWHLDATSDGAVLQPDVVPPYKQIQLLIGPLYNQTQPVMEPPLHSDGEMQPVIGSPYQPMQPLMLYNQMQPV